MDSTPDHLVSANINPTGKKYNDMPQIRRLFAAVLEKAKELPGVTDAAMNQEQPFEWTFGDLNAPFHIPGQPVTEPGKEPTSLLPRYFSGLFQNHADSDRCRARF